MTNEKMIEDIRNDFINYCRNNKLIVPFFSKKVNRVVYDGITIALKTLSTNHKKEIKDICIMLGGNALEYSFEDAKKRIDDLITQFDKLKSQLQEKDKIVKEIEKLIKYYVEPPKKDIPYFLTKIEHLSQKHNKEGK